MEIIFNNFENLFHHCFYHNARCQDRQRSVLKILRSYRVLLSTSLRNRVLSRYLVSRRSSSRRPRFSRGNSMPCRQNAWKQVGRHARYVNRRVTASIPSLSLSLLSKGRKRVLIGPGGAFAYARSRCRRYYRLTTTRTTLSRRDSPPSITLSAIFPPQFAPSCNELNLPVETRLLPRIVPTNRYGNSSFTKFLCREGGGKGDFYTGDILNLALERRREKSSYSNDNTIPTNWRS